MFKKVKYAKYKDQQMVAPVGPTCFTLGST